MADQAPTAPACPVAALAREAGALIGAHRRLDERLLALGNGPERVLAETADRAVTDRLSAVETVAATARARSLEGALFQLVLAKADVDCLRGLAGVAATREAAELAGRVGGLLHSAVAALEEACGTRRGAFAGE